MGITGIIVSLMIIIGTILASFCVLCLIFVAFLFVATVFFAIGEGLKFCFEAIEESKTYIKINNYIYNNKSFDYHNKFIDYKKIIFKVMYIVLYILSVAIFIYAFYKLINLVDFKLIFEKYK